MMTAKGSYFCKQIASLCSRIDKSVPKLFRKFRRPFIRRKFDTSFETLKHFTFHIHSRLIVGLVAVSYIYICERMMQYDMGAVIIGEGLITNLDYHR